MNDDEESTRLPIVLPVLAVLAMAGYIGWHQYQSRQAEPDVATPATSAAPATVPQDAAPAPEVAAEPAIQHPVEPPPAEAGAEPPPALAKSDAALIAQLNALLGSSTVKTYVHPDGIARRFVATVDNLGRAQAPVMAWPVKPTPGRFSTTPGSGEGQTIHPNNQRRYTPFVAMVEAVDSARAAAAYRRLYPLFQQAYEELGYPGRYFNDRLVQVLDQLIATPVPSAPLAVRLVEVKGPLPSSNPWVRYEFADPALESLSAGQKILLRMGPDNQRRLQAELSAFRQQVAKR